MMWIYDTSSDRNYGVADGRDVIRVAIKNNSSDVMFVRWDNVRVKLGNNDPVDAIVYGKVKGQRKVRQTADITYLKKKSAVYDIEPDIKYITSANPFYTNPLIVEPSDLRNGKMKVQIMVEVCRVEENPGYVPRKCSAKGDGWERYLIKGQLGILGMIPTLLEN